METLEVSAKQFREKQKSFFEMADNGKQIIIKRGKKQAYLLSPVENNDFVVTQELLERLEKSRQQYRDGKVTVCKTIEELYNFLDSL